jgi:hypothetical protein
MKSYQETHALEHANFLNRKQNYGNGKTRIPLFIFCLARSSPMLYSANLVDFFLGHLLKFAVRTRSPAAEHFGNSNGKK